MSICLRRLLKFCCGVVVVAMVFRCVERNWIVFVGGSACWYCLVEVIVFRLAGGVPVGWALWLHRCCAGWYRFL